MKNIFKSTKDGNTTGYTACGISFDILYIIKLKIDKIFRLWYNSKVKKSNRMSIIKSDK